MINSIGKSDSVRSQNLRQSNSKNKVNYNFSQINFKGAETKSISLFRKMFGKTVKEILENGAIKKIHFNGKGVKKFEMIINSNKSRVRTDFEADGKTPEQIRKFSTPLYLEEYHLLKDGKPNISVRFSDNNNSHEHILFVGEKSCVYEKVVNNFRKAHMYLKFKQKPEIGVFPKISWQYVESANHIKD